MNKAENLENNLRSVNTLEWLNAEFRSLTPEQRLARITRAFPAERILITSSFGADSALFLDALARATPLRRIHFIDTGFHFAETLAYQAELAARWQLEIVRIVPDAKLHQYSADNELWRRDPDLCCSVNKVQPLDEISAPFTLWITGLMSWQTAHRQSLPLFEQAGALLKFHPLLDLTALDAAARRHEHALPIHPLAAAGYASIGCSHCTRPGNARAGRWSGKSKSECGLHTKAKI